MAGEKSRGRKHTEETKRRIGRANKGRKFTEEHKSKIGESNKGKIISQETRKKISIATKGRIPWNKGKSNIYSEETKEKWRKIRNGRLCPWLKGKIHTEETKKKIGDANRGKIKTEETKEKLRNKMKGRKITEEHKRKMSEGHKNSDKSRYKGFDDYRGTKPTEETKKKISASRKGKTLTEETKKKIGDASRGRKLSKESIEKRLKTIAANGGFKHSQETKERISKKIADKYLFGDFRPEQGGKKGYFYSNKNKKKLFYRSSYELTAYEILEQISKVRCYDTEPFRIPYKYNKNIHNTIPDILITYTDESKELIEVKPEWKLEDKKTILKLSAMKKYAKNNDMDFSVWTETDLNLN